MTDQPTVPAPTPEPANRERVILLNKAITKKIATCEQKRNKNKLGAITLQLASVLFTVGTTVLIGFKVQDLNKSTLANWSLIVSALASATVTLDKFFDYKDFWIQHNVAITKLNFLFFKLEYQSARPGFAQQDLDKLCEEFEMICIDLDKNYKEIRSAKDA